MKLEEKYLDEALSPKDIELLRKRGKLGKDFSGFTTTVTSKSKIKKPTRRAAVKKTTPLKKKLEQETKAPLKVGDILYSSWGYDQTNIDWYQVVSVTKSGKSVKIRKLKDKKTSDGDLSMSGKTTPLKNKFDGKEMSKKIQMYGGKPYVKIESYAHAYLWDGKAKSFTSYA